ncbi:MAG: transglutaminase-like domain-containing protein [Nanoarchaeota archaeon]|nr:transglutaminase-like domain-containing protein [Nanoarchaeota archaeon]
MKRVLIVLFLILISPIVNAQAENYNDVQYVEMILKINSSIGIDYLDDDYKIDYIKGDLSFFPGNDDRQTVISLTPFSSPEANVQQTDGEIVYTWSDGLERSINYGYEAKIKVENDVARIEEKIKFPLTKLDSVVLEYTQPSEFIDINSKIEKKANEIVGTEDDLYSVAFKLAKWTNENIEYNLTTLTAEVVQPSSWVLENGEGVCDELTNLFISLLRSIGVPARFVSGMVYSNVNYEWGTHGWAEVYFPGKGWVPFDVTFGEYGWLDPSHIKLKTDVDSGSPTAKYSWKSSGIDIDIGQLDIDTNLVGTGPKEPGAVEIEVIPLKSTASFGSYIPVEVKLKNIKSSYFAPKIVVTKAPGLTEPNVKSILLKPKEEKSLYWIAEIPRADADYTYTTTFEVNSMYGESAEGIIKYGDRFESYSKDWAESFVSTQLDREKKNTLSEIDIMCSADRELYYSGDEAVVTCDLFNKDADNIEFNMCFQDSCEKIKIGSGETINKTKSFDVDEGIRIPIIMENNEKVKYYYVNLNVIPIPEVKISNLEPEEIDYKGSVEISFDISSNTDIKNLVITFDFDERTYDTFKSNEVKTVTIHTFGSQLLNDLKFEVSYEDKLGKKYVEQKALHVNVVNVPWYGGILSWFIGLF